jgi:hypothetical protein
MKKTKRVHILSAVNAANISKAGSVYTIKDVCGAINDIVMNNRLYPADQLAAGVASLEGKPAPAGHPKNAAGQYISALNGEALASAWIGSYAKNARHEGGRTLVDVVVNEVQAKAHTHGVKLIERLDAAIAGTNAEPIHVSTGLICEEIKANGESLGKKYSAIACNLQYDHLAILLDSAGAGTPEQGVGMFLNSEGNPEEVETVTANTDPDDKRSAGLLKWVKRLLVNGSELSFDQITDGLRALLPKDTWPREVFDRYVVWADYNADKLYRQDYSISSDGSLALTSDPIEVVRKVEYKPISISNSEKEDSVKTHILAVLNTAGISVAGLDDPQILALYNAHQAKPAADALTAANSKLAELELKANAAVDAELTTLATSLAVNTSLKPEDFKAMGLARCKELAATGKAAPVIVGNTGKPADEMAGYSLNAINNDRQPKTVSNKTVTGALLPCTFVTEGASALAAATAPGPMVRLLSNRDFYSEGSFTATDPLLTAYVSGETGVAYILEPAQTYQGAAAAATYAWGTELTVGAAGRLVTAVSTNLVIGFSKSAGAKSAGDLIDFEVALPYVKA